MTIFFLLYFIMAVLTGIFLFITTDWQPGFEDPPVWETATLLVFFSILWPIWFMYQAWESNR